MHLNLIAINISMPECYYSETISFSKLAFKMGQLDRKNVSLFWFDKEETPLLDIEWCVAGAIDAKELFELNRGLIEVYKNALLPYISLKYRKQFLQALL